MTHISNEYLPLNVKNRLRYEESRDMACYVAIGKDS